MSKHVENANTIAGRADPTGGVIYSSIDTIEPRLSPGLPSPASREEVYR